MNGRREDRILYLPSPHPDQQLRLHLDENISGAIAKLLRQRGFDVTTAADVGLRAQSDTEHMSFAAQQQRIIVTRDRDFLQLHDQQHAHAGIVYWPHNETTPLGDMEELLVHVLLRVSQEPTAAAELDTGRPAVPRRKRKRPAPTHRVSKGLPAGLLVQGTVEFCHQHTLDVRLSSGQLAQVLPHRVPAPVPDIGTAIQAVTVQYVKSQRQLQLSMRRQYSLARSMPTQGLKQLRRNDHELIRSLQKQELVEIVLEAEHTVRIYGVSPEAVRGASARLNHQLPWNCSAVLRLNKAELQQWMRSVFGGGVGMLSQATGTLVRHFGTRSLIVSARSNRELDSLLRHIAQQVPDVEVVAFQAARAEPLMPCHWPRQE